MRNGCPWPRSPAPVSRWCHRTSGSRPQRWRTSASVPSRAHLGVYADDLNRLGRPALIRGVSLMSDRAERQMGPQDGLYTVAEREPDDDVTLRVVGSMTSVRTGAAAVFDAVSAPTTDLVTVTITEGGYDIPSAAPDLDSPSPWVPEIIARALAHRRQAGSAPPIIASLDNLLDNGEVLRQHVLNSAERLDPTLPGWIAEQVAFPSSVVDRMVPAPTDDDRRDVEARLGLLDLATVSAERYRSWILSATEGLPPLADVGVQVVADVTPFERRKLWLLNGPHSAFAYCGLLAGCDTIAVGRRNYSRPFLRAGDDRRHAGGGAFPGFPRAPPGSRRRPCTDSPIRASVIPACRWGPTGRASCHSASSPSSTPAWRSASTPRGSPVSWHCGSLPPAAWRFRERRCLRWLIPTPRACAQPSSAVTCLRWSTWLSGEPTMPRSAGSWSSHSRIWPAMAWPPSGTPGDRLPRTTR